MAELLGGVGLVLGAALGNQTLKSTAAKALFALTVAVTPAKHLHVHARGHHARGGAGCSCRDEISCYKVRNAGGAVDDIGRHGVWTDRGSR